MAKKTSTVREDIAFLLKHRNKILRKLPSVYKSGDTEKVQRFMEAIQHLTREIESMKREEQHG